MGVRCFNHSRSKRAWCSGSVRINRNLSPLFCSALESIQPRDLRDDELTAHPQHSETLNFQVHIQTSFLSESSTGVLVKALVRRRL